MAKTIHLVSLDVPYPPDYGGAIDIYYKIKALRDIGVGVVLHAFQYGRPASAELETLCEQVHYYSRTKRVSLRLPYVVSSRGSRRLLENLAADGHAILFDGMHTCRHLGHPSLSGRQQWVRMHNVEWHYYRGLARSTRDAFRRLYFRWEAGRLRSFEQRLAMGSGVFAISLADRQYFTERGLHAVHLPPFHANQWVQAQPGRGDYCLYFGNLSVAENAAAARFVIERVLGGTPIRLVVAGRGPTHELRQAAAAHANVELVADPPVERLDELMRAAHVVLLPTFQATGMKLKLLDALYRCRFVVANPEMVAGTGVESLCTVVGDEVAMRAAVEQLMKRRFTKEEIEARRGHLESAFSTRRGAELITETMGLT